MEVWAMKKVLQWLRRHLWRHHWCYRNSYNRYCTVCGRHEVVFSNGRYAFDERSWWEVFDEGQASKHYEH